MSEKEVSIYTDGACLGNPGRGGYGVVLCYNANQKQLSGGFRLTTNNRMEIMAAIVGLEALKSPCKVNLYTDSKYLADAMTKGWAQRWKTQHTVRFRWIKGHAGHELECWRRNKREKAVNPDLWSKLLKLCEQHTVRFRWIKGHAGHEWNEICDKLSKEAASENNLPDDDGYISKSVKKLPYKRRAVGFAGACCHNPNSELRHGKTVCLIGSHCSDFRTLVIVMQTFLTLKIEIFPLGKR